MSRRLTTVRAHPGRFAFFSVLGYPPFRYFWFGQLAINFGQQLCGDESGRGDDERVGLCRAALDPHVERIADALHRSHRAMTLDVHVELSRERINQFAHTSPQG